MMKPFRSTIPLDEALTIVREAIVPIARTERVPIEAAHGRVLAETITAAADVPSFTRSAMDGYAVIAADTQNASRDHAITLTLAGRLYAGDTSDGNAAITSGMCMEIATGAPLPAGADAVVMVEETALAETTSNALSTSNALGAAGAANAADASGALRAADAAGAAGASDAAGISSAPNTSSSSGTSRSSGSSGSSGTASAADASRASSASGAAGASSASDAAGISSVPCPSGTSGSSGRSGASGTSGGSGAPGAAIDIFAPVRPGQHIVRRGADMREGNVVLEPGVTLEPSRIGALAAIGIAEVEVFAKPVVAILPTGNELVTPGKPLPPGHVYDMNRYTLGALVERHGGIARQLPAVLDTPEAVRQALESVSGSNISSNRSSNSGSNRSSDSIRGDDDESGSGGNEAGSAETGSNGPVDLLIFCGGSSVGERDLVIDALREKGEVLFHGIAVKPGKPTAFARLGSTLVLGMPGNPTSCLSNAYVLMIPLLREIARLPASRPTIVRAPLSQRVTSPKDRLQFLPVRLDDGKAAPTFKGSGEITSLSQADGYIIIPLSEEAIEAGTPVDVILY